MGEGQGEGNKLTLHFLERCDPHLNPLPEGEEKK